MKVEIEIKKKDLRSILCAEKMFTREEFKTLEAEALDRYLMHLDELQRDNTRHGYGVCL